MTSQLTTHVLDSATGMPAGGIEVELHVADTGPIAAAVTDADGRAGVGPETLAEGDYTLTFATGAYFASRGVESFYPHVAVTFRVTGDRHYHVPLLLSPFAYSTYRGS